MVLQNTNLDMNSSDIESTSFGTILQSSDLLRLLNFIFNLQFFEKWNQHSNINFLF